MALEDVDNTIYKFYGWPWQQNDQYQEEDLQDDAKYDRRRRLGGSLARVNTTESSEDSAGMEPSLKRLVGSLGTLPPGLRWRTSQELKADYAQHAEIPQPHYSPTREQADQGMHEKQRSSGPANVEEQEGEEDWHWGLDTQSLLKRRIVAEAQPTDLHSIYYLVVVKNPFAWVQSMLIHPGSWLLKHEFPPTVVHQHAYEQGLKADGSRPKVNLAKWTPSTGKAKYSPKQLVQVWTDFYALWLNFHIAHPERVFIFPYEAFLTGEDIVASSLFSFFGTFWPASKKMKSMEERDQRGAFRKVLAFYIAIYICVYGIACSSISYNFTLFFCFDEATYTCYCTLLHRPGHCVWSRLETTKSEDE